MRGTVDRKAGDLERELMGRLRALTEENRRLSPALEAAQKLVDHRRTTDELIEQGLRDAVRLGELQEDIQDLEGKREALRQIVDQNVAALRQQFEETLLAMHGALELLSGAQDFARAMESRLSALLEELKEVEFISGDGDDGSQFDVQRQALPNVESIEEAQAESADHESPFRRLGQDGPAFPQVRLEDTGEVPQEGPWDKGAAEPGPASPQGPGATGETDISKEQTPGDKVRTEAR